MDSRRAFRIATALAYAGPALFVLTGVISGAAGFSALALILPGLTIAALCIRNAFYRCPRCRESLGDVHCPIPKPCPHCGKPLK